MKFGILEAPTPLGLWPSGVQYAPQVLLEMGLAVGLSAAHLGRVEPSSYCPIRDPATMVLNPSAIALHSEKVALAVSQALCDDTFPIVLGGDCSVLLGPAIALKLRGRHGLLFIDGHMDYWTPALEPRGEAASMDLALVTGEGPDVLTNISGLKPYFRSEDCFSYGARDHLFDPDFIDMPFEVPIARFDLNQVRSLGPKAIDRAIDHMIGPNHKGFWIHLDVDALDDETMPAVDYRMPGGLMLEELSELLKSALGTRKAVGLTITIYNPNLDPSRRSARALVSTLIAALRSPALG